MQTQDSKILGSVTEDFITTQEAAQDHVWVHSFSHHKGTRMNADQHSGAFQDQEAHILKIDCKPTYLMVEAEMFSLSHWSVKIETPALCSILLYLVSILQKLSIMKGEFVHCLKNLWTSQKHVDICFS